MFKLPAVFSYSMEIRLSVSGCMHWSAGRGREDWMCARISEEGVPGGVQWRVLQRRSSDSRYGNDVIICEWEGAGLIVEFEFLGFSRLSLSLFHTPWLSKPHLYARWRKNSSRGPRVNVDCSLFSLSCTILFHLLKRGKKKAPVSKQNIKMIWCS